MTIDRLRAHWGFSRMPFAKDLAPSMLYSHRSHAEAVARVTWCIDEVVMGVVTGEVGSGKTVAVRAALAGIDYLGLLASRRDAEMARAINYAQLTLPGAPEPDNATDENAAPTNDNEETPL